MRPEDSKLPPHWFSRIEHLSSLICCYPSLKSKTLKRWKQQDLPVIEYIDAFGLDKDILTTYLTLRFDDKWAIDRMTVYNQEYVLLLPRILKEEERQAIDFLKGCLENCEAYSRKLNERKIRTTLKILACLVEWCLSDIGLYIAGLDNKLEHLQLPGLELLEEHFKQFNLCLESLNECRAALETNIRVWTAMSNFYSGLVSNKLASDVRKPACWKVQEASFKEYIRQFVAKMRESQKLAQDMLRMIDMMIKIGSWREDTIQRIVQNRNEKIMTRLTHLASKDAATIRVFANVTLVLLPIIVVSTIFTTEIVKFRHEFDSSETIGTGSRQDKFSLQAFAWWSDSSGVATVAIMLWTWWRRRRVLARLKSGQSQEQRSDSSERMA